MVDININFEIAKIRHNINHHGMTYTFKRVVLDEFKENTSETVDVISIDGLFHQVRGYIDKQVSDGTIRRSKPQPMILVLAEDLTKDIQIDDFVEINGSKYTVTGVNNVNNLNIAFDISMEMADNGT